jgi:hypothetical protein
MVYGFEVMYRETAGIDMISEAASLVPPSVSRSCIRETPTCGPDFL